MREWFDSMYFNYPQALWLLPVSLLLLTLGIYLLRHRLLSWSSLHQTLQQHHYRHPLARLISEMSSTDLEVNLRKQTVRHWLAYAVLIVLLQLALAQPYRLGERLPDPPQYRDIIFLVDTSISMSLRDYLVNQQRVARMTIVKSVLQHFINGLSNSRIGLVAFSEQSYLLVPLTTDHQLLNYQLQRLEPATLTGRRSDPGKALLYTLDHLRTSQSDSSTPVLVMLTDANRPVRNIDPRAAAALIKQHGLRLHTIAMGAGSQAGKEKLATSLIYQPANFKLLEEIATAGGGEFFHANSQSSLDQVLRRIQSTEKHQIQNEPVYIKLPLYHWPLATALIWILLWQLLPQFRMRLA